MSPEESAATDKMLADLQASNDFGRAVIKLIGLHCTSREQVPDYIEELRWIATLLERTHQRAQENKLCPKQPQTPCLPP